MKLPLYGSGGDQHLFGNVLYGHAVKIMKTDCQPCPLRKILHNAPKHFLFFPDNHAFRHVGLSGCSDSFDLFDIHVFPATGQHVPGTVRADPAYPRAVLSGALQQAQLPPGRHKSILSRVLRRIMVLDDGIG